MRERTRPPENNGPENVFTMPSPEPAMDDCFRALTHPERRQLVRRLDQHEDARTVGELADEIATHESNTSLTATQLAMQIHHKHLPLLVETNFAEQTSQNRVRATDNTAKAVHMLDTAADIFP